MSRYHTTLVEPVEMTADFSGELDNGEKATAVKVAYGWDHAVGIFIQFIDAEGCVILDRDALFGKLTREAMLELIEKHKIAIRPNHLAAIQKEWEF